MIPLAVISALLLPDAPPRYVLGAPRSVADLGELRATCYWPGDGASGTVVGCPAEALRAHGTRSFAALVAAGVSLVAHRSLPCGARLLLCGPGGCALGVVLDRGPYGQDCPEGYHVGARLAAGCEWRGDVDLTPAVAEAVGLPGARAQRRGVVRAWRMR